MGCCHLRSVAIDPKDQASTTKGTSNAGNVAMVGPLMDGPTVRVFWVSVSVLRGRHSFSLCEHSDRQLSDRPIP
jgi:hypothetical protein